MSDPSCPVDAADPRFRPAAAAVPQEWVRLRDYLARHDLDLAPEPAPRQFAQGFGNLNYLLHIGGTPCVLRRPPVGELPAGANDMAREHRILSRLAPAFPLAPHALHYCGDAAVLGAPFLIMEYRHGLVIGAELPARARLGARDCGRLAEDMVKILVQLHALDPQALGLGELGRPEGLAARTIDGWQRRAIAAYGERLPPAIARVADWLRAALPPPAPPVLLHNDFKLDNVILHPESLRPRAVIDWDMGTRGDALMDVAILLSYWTQADDPPVMHELRQMPTAAAGFPSRAELLQAYAAHTGLDAAPFRFWRVLALFRLTVVFMQLHARYLRREVQDERHRGFGALAAGLLDFTLAEAASTQFL